MTDILIQARQERLLNDLRNADLPDSVMCDDAANEIERLAKKLKEENRKVTKLQQELWLEKELNRYDD